jgi:hypothetical protein
MMHQVLPHVHHEHIEVEPIAEVENHRHHHNNDHHHRHEAKKKAFDFLGFLLAYHAHNIDVNTILSTKIVVNKRVASLSFQVDLLPVLETLIQVDIYKKQCFYGHAPPDIDKNLFRATISLRGPPALG